MSCHPGVHPSAHTLAVRAGAPEGSGGWARPLVGRGGLVTLFPSVTIASSLLHRQKYVVSDKLHGHPPRGSQTWRMSFCAPAKCMAQGCSGRTASGCCKPNKWPLPLAVPGGQGGTSPLPAARWPGPCSTAHPCVPGCGSWRTPPGPELARTQPDPCTALVHFRVAPEEARTPFDRRRLHRRHIKSQSSHIFQAVPGVG